MKTIQAIERESISLRGGGFEFASFRGLRGRKLAISIWDSGESQIVIR
jgi:hypothetical protein